MDLRHGMRTVFWREPHDVTNREAYISIDLVVFILRSHDYPDIYSAILRSSGMFTPYGDLWLHDDKCNIWGQFVSFCLTSVVSHQIIGQHAPLDIDFWANHKPTLFCRFSCCNDHFNCTSIFMCSELKYKLHFCWFDHCYFFESNYLPWVSCVAYVAYPFVFVMNIWIECSIYGRQFISDFLHICLAITFSCYTLCYIKNCDVPCVTNDALWIPCRHSNSNSFSHNKENHLTEKAQVREGKHAGK